MPRPSLTPQDLVSLVQVGEAKISPDGRWVAYQQRQALIEQNLWATDLWLVGVVGDGEPRRLTRETPLPNQFVTLAFQWTPDSTGIVYCTSGPTRELVKIHLDGTVEAIPGTENMLSSGGDGDQRDEWNLTHVALSPDGRCLAFVRTAPPTPARSSSLRGLQLDPCTGPVFPMRAQRLGTTALAVLDLQTKDVAPLTDDSLNVSAFAWSPDSSRLVVVADAAPSEEAEHVVAARDREYQRTFVYVIDVDTRAITPLVQTQGQKLNPAWSPDGRWITYVSHVDGWDPMHHSLPAVVEVETGALSYLGRRNRDVVGAVSSWTRLIWSEDSRFLYVEAGTRMRSHLFRARVPNGEFEQISPPADAHLSSFTLAGDTVAFIQKTVDEPGDVFVASLGDFQPRQVTHLNAHRNRAVEPSARQIVYRSADDKWDIDATVLLPPDYEEGQRYPLIVELLGGPSMVPLWYNIRLGYPTRCQASRGYVVLRPNTRGRSGMGSLSMARAIQTERSLGANPWSDVMTGVDLLIDQGIVDPNRMGVLGHSYGSYLSAYGITQTGRFRAASFHDGPMDWPGLALRGLRRLDSGDALGIGNIHDPAEFDRIRQESPLHNTHRVTTPCLVEVGAESMLAEEGSMMARALISYGVPCDFVAYPRSGHTTDEVALILDAFERNLAWFDYWLLDTPTPGWDFSRYDAWKQTQATA